MCYECRGRREIMQQTEMFSHSMEAMLKCKQVGRRIELDPLLVERWSMGTRMGFEAKNGPQEVRREAWNGHESQFSPDRKKCTRFMHNKSPREVKNNEHISNRKNVCSVKELVWRQRAVTAAINIGATEATTGVGIAFPYPHGYKEQRRKKKIIFST